ncbi:S8 family peptidase [Allostreptomyces psammosilenae]|uniref:Subtilisin family serine protease n=1 Tax=Allostreptomyces psammosilenae TaxID=1892865 RepID=A0A853A0P5_9ACTN|nr:S8 family peptidase [Allostreptomyces psammosilenae]NYI06504.1 subtilisin family serine protease [Allostreptomyces psammosilenae]
MARTRTTITTTRRATGRLAGALAGLLALGATALPAAAQAAPAGAPTVGVIANAGARDVVPGSYLVTLEDSVGISASAAGPALAARYGGEVTHTYTAALNGFAAELTEAEARRLAADPAVASVVHDQYVRAAGTQPNPPSWGLDRIDQTDLPLDRSYTWPDPGGRGVNVYVIDTGVRTSHGDFGGRARSGWDFVGNDPVAEDGNGHGTHVAGIVGGIAHGVAKNANIIGVRVLNASGSGTIAQVVAGVDWVTANHVRPAVANMSLGGAANTTLDAAVTNAIAAGVTFTVAAGNSASNAASFSPARVTAAVTVGASTAGDAVSTASNYGSVLDLYAPGASITSTWGTGDTATATLSGTSMAAAHAAGAAALYLDDHGTATPAQVELALEAAAVPNTLTGVPPGTPNLLLNVRGL